MSDDTPMTDTNAASSHAADDDSKSRKRQHGDDDDAAAMSDSESKPKKKQKRIEEDEAEEAEEEEEEPSSKKKRKHPGAKFIDDIAVNEDDEEEPDDEDDDEPGSGPEDEDGFIEEDNGDGEEDEGEDLTDERGIKRDQRDAAGEHGSSKKKGKKGRRGGASDHIGGEDETMHMTLDQERDQKEMSEMAQRLEARYKDDSYDDDYDEEGANRASSGAVLPSVRDPSLFILRVGKGEREDDVVYQLLLQYYKRESDPDPSRRLLITSVFTTPASKGYIYVEAFREVHVAEAIKSLPKQRMVSYYASSKKNIKIPITEMVAAIKFNSTTQSVQLKQWVRFKRGPVKDDLAQVIDIQDQGTLITLKFVPRIDFLFLEAKRKNPDLKRADFMKGSGQRRPPQKYFDEREIRSLGFPVEKKHGAGRDKHTQFYHFMNQKFRNGFQFKDIKIDGLETENVAPSAGELEKFTNKAADSDDDEDGEEKKAEEDALAQATAASMMGPRKPVVYSQGDRVQIIDGALRNVTGRVVSISKDRLTIRADLASITELIEEVPSHVRKYFSIGAHVKVVTGPYKNETGMICHVPDDAEEKLAIHTDISQRTIEVASQDVIESSEVSTGRDTLGNYELFDLVQLTNDVVGVIIRVHMASFYVMTNTGQVQQIKLQEVQHKREDRWSHTMDKNRDSITRDDVVVVLTGPQRGLKAAVKHIFKNSLFCHSREVLDNGGMFVIRGDQVALIGGRASQRATGARSPGAGARSPGVAPQSPGRSGMAMPRPGGFRRDPLIGKDVKITGGNYKGYAGICIEVREDGQAKVELRGLFRKVPIPRNQIMEVEVVASRLAQNPFYGSQTPLIGGATPAHSGFGGATPHHDAFGSQTPAHSSRTPSRQHDGDVWSAQTPAHRPNEDRGGADLEVEDDEWRTSMGMATPAMIPPTPVGMPMTPGAPIRTPMEPPPQTPVAPSTPYVEQQEYEEEAAAEPEVVVKSEGFSDSRFVGCLVRVNGAKGVLIEVLDNGASLKVQLGSETSTHLAADVLPWAPDGACDARFLREFTGGDGNTHAQGTRIKVISTAADDAIIEPFGVVPLSELCKISPEYATKEEDEEDEPQAASSSSKPKKVKKEKKRR